MPTRYGRLEVLEIVGPLAHCRCDCGTYKTFRLGNMRYGFTRSCGCLQRELTAARSQTHGYGRRGPNRSPEYRAWCHLRERCLNPNTKNYNRYGGRGVTVCDRWRESFENFLADMGRRPSAKHSIDRIDSDGPYAPNNCRWASRLQQSQNRAFAKPITHNGETMCLSAWARRASVTRLTLYKRLQRGWTFERAISTH